MMKHYNINRTIVYYFFFQFSTRASHTVSAFGCASGTLFLFQYTL